MPEEEATDAAFGANLTETFTPLFQRVSITGEEDTGGVSSIDYNRSTTRSSLSVLNFLIHSVMLFICNRALGVYCSEKKLFKMKRKSRSHDTIQHFHKDE